MFNVTPSAKALGEPAGRPDAAERLRRGRGEKGKTADAAGMLLRDRSCREDAERLPAGSRERPRSSHGVAESDGWLAEEQPSVVKRLQWSR